MSDDIKLVVMMTRKRATTESYPPQRSEQQTAAPTAHTSPELPKARTLTRNTRTRQRRGPMSAALLNTATEVHVGSRAMWRSHKNKRLTLFTPVLDLCGRTYGERGTCPLWRPFQREGEGGRERHGEREEPPQW